MKRYQELVAAAKIVGVAKLDQSNEDGYATTSPAWCKLHRIQDYLIRQAAHVMDGRDEDGKEPHEFDAYCAFVDGLELAGGAA